jgi:hypothetical protein
VRGAKGPRVFPTGSSARGHGTDGAALEAVGARRPGWPQCSPQGRLHCSARRCAHFAYTVAGLLAARALASDVTWHLQQLASEGRLVAESVSQL